MPCLPDPASIQRIDEGWFGRVQPMVKTLIRTEARDTLRTHRAQLQSNPLDDAGLFAHVKGGAATTALP